MRQRDGAGKGGGGDGAVDLQRRGRIGQANADIATVRDGQPIGEIRVKVQAILITAWLALRGNAFAAGCAKKRPTPLVVPLLNTPLLAF